MDHTASQTGTTRSRSTSPVYEALLEPLIEQEPNSGYQRPTQIPDLTRAELVAVWQREPALLADAVYPDSVMRLVSHPLAETAYPGVLCCSLIGSAILDALQDEAKKVLLLDVQEAIEREAEAARAEADEQRYAAGDHRSANEVAMDYASITSRLFA